jgi:hypothetical protein
MGHKIYVTVWHIRFACWISKATCTHARACTPSRTWYLHARTHAHTHRQIHNTYCFFMAKIIRERASVLRYMYIACVVFYKVRNKWYEERTKWINTQMSADSNRDKLWCELDHCCTKREQKQLSCNSVISSRGVSSPGVWIHCVGALC